SALLGPIAVEVSNNGIDVSYAGLQFVYQDSIIVTSVVPTSGQENGGGVVTVNGANFVNSGLLSCRFGGLNIVLARYRSSFRAECSIPSGISGNSTIEISNNAVDFSASGVKFLFEPELRITSVVPSVAPPAGGIEITVQGLFAATRNYVCMF